MRLQKYLAACSVASRRACESLIEAGRVSVNGQVAVLGSRVDPTHDEIILDGARVEQDQKVYVVLHKPKGVVTSVKDPMNPNTVMDLMEGVQARIFPIGRLDKDATGTLLLTNDGELTYRLSHPKFDVDKVYLAWVRGVMSDETAGRLSRGVKLEDGPSAAARVHVLERKKDTSLARLVVHEGRKRLVKRMCASVNHPVYDLRRVSIGGISVGDLAPGDWRYLDGEEVDALKRLVDLST